VLVSVSQKEEQRNVQASNSNRMYTPEEDQEILDYWWDRSARADLCRRLGRTQAAVAQRFYAIVKARNIDPKKYRQEKRRLAKENMAVRNTQSWTDAEEMKLWRLVKSGMSLDDASRELGRPVAECMRKLSELKAENMLQVKESDAEVPEGRGVAETAPVELTPKIAQPSEAERFFSDADLVASPQLTETPREELLVEKAEKTPVQSAPTSRSDDDILEILREFPQQVRAIENRLSDLEKENQLLRENLEFVLQEVAEGLKNTGGFLSEQRTHFTAFQQLKQEKQALEQELEALRTKMEEEKRELRKTYQEIDFWLGEFLKLRKIEKVASLSDLIPRLKYSYDRFGVLLNIHRE